MQGQALRRNLSGNIVSLKDISLAVMVALLFCGQRLPAQEPVSDVPSGSLIEPPLVEPRLHDSTGYEIYPDQPCCDPHWLADTTLFAGIDGSKQPQDFGVNANLGGRFSVHSGVPLVPEAGLGLQIGAAYVPSNNAVRVYELLGEETSRDQLYTTIGLFQRTDGPLAWGFAYDFLHEDSFDEFSLSQWRVRVSYQLDPCNEVGITGHISDRQDTGTFNGPAPITVRLAAIDQGSVYWRHTWQTGAQTSIWLGLAEGHGENNAVTGASAAQDTMFLFGADVLVPLNDHLAFYGETNLIMPSDTGTVDAFLGFQWYPWGSAHCHRQTRFAPLLPLAAATSFSVDLRQ